MECIYIEDLENDSVRIELEDDEAKHILALRLDTGDTILATNGRGIMAEVELERSSRKSFYAKPIKFDFDAGEPSRNVTLALGALDDKARMEFALEKAVELGIIRFIPLVTDYTQRIKYNSLRILTKAIAALKQSKRSRIPELHEPTSFKELLEKHLDAFDTIILADERGEVPNIADCGTNIIALVGPEGGFSEAEISSLLSFKSNSLPNQKILRWNLANRRLRAETAAIATLSFLSLND